MFRAMTAPRVLVITPKLHERFWAKVNKDGPTQPHMTTPCWLWTAAHIGKYGMIQVKLADGRFVAEFAHRVAWVLTHGALPPKNVCHACDVPDCIRPSHLWEGTPLANSQDMVAKGRAAAGDRNGSRLHPEAHSKGEDHYEARITEDDVRAIRQAAGKVTLKDLAGRYHMTPQAIWRIVHRQTWKHVE